MLSALAVIAVVTSCSVGPTTPTTRPPALPRNARIGLAVYGSNSTASDLPLTPGEAARVGRERASDLPYGTDGAANLLPGMVALAAIPVFSMVSALQGVPEAERTAASGVVRTAFASTDWQRVFQEEVRRRVSETAGHDLSLAPKAGYGLVNPAWKGRYDAVLAVDFNAPALRGNGGVNPDLRVETRVYWTLIDPATGSSIAGGPAIGQSSKSQPLVKWSRDGAPSLAEAGMQSTRHAADLVADAAFSSRPRSPGTE